MQVVQVAMAQADRGELYALTPGWRRRRIVLVEDRAHGCRVGTWERRGDGLVHAVSHTVQLPSPPATGCDISACAQCAVTAHRSAVTDWCVVYLPGGDCWSYANRDAQSGGVRGGKRTGGR